MAMISFVALRLLCFAMIVSLRLRKNGRPRNGSGLARAGLEGAGLGCVPGDRYLDWQGFPIAVALKTLHNIQ